MMNDNSDRLPGRRGLLLCSFWLLAALGLLALLAACGSAGEVAPTRAVASLPNCSNLEEISQFQTPDPSLPPTRTPTPVPGTRVPTPTPGPAAAEDRVGLPNGYEDSYKLLFVVDRTDNKTVRVVCGNEVAATHPPGTPYPYGSILIMEIWRARLDEDGRPVKDEDGRLIRTDLSTIWVMRKEQGFGEGYQRQQTGEWEYVGYRPDGTYQTEPDMSNSCADCHVKQSGEEADWLFRSDLFYHYADLPAAPEPGGNEVYAFIYSFVPQVRTVQAGATVTWTNLDELIHTMTAADRSWDSGPVRPGDSFSHTFNEPGRFLYLCTIHRGITAEIEVTE